MTNAPTFRQYVAEAAGTVKWYVAPRRRPAIEVRKGYAHHFTPKAFNALKASFEATFGVVAV